jgi:hypothetical protein
MNTRLFVSGSSLILASWLGATFLNEVPAQRYPRLDKKSATTAAITQKSRSEVILATRVEAVAPTASPLYPTKKVSF